MSIDFEDLFNFEEKYGEPETEGSSEFGSPTPPSSATSRFENSLAAGLSGAQRESQPSLYHQQQQGSSTSFSHEGGPGSFSHAQSFSQSPPPPLSHHHHNQHHGQGIHNHHYQQQQLQHSYQQHYPTSEEHLHHNQLQQMHLHHQAHSALLLIDSNNNSASGSVADLPGSPLLHSPSDAGVGGGGNLEDSYSASGSGSGIIYPGLSDEISSASAALSHLHSQQIHHLLQQQQQSPPHSHSVGSPRDSQSSGSYYASIPITYGASGHSHSQMHHYMHAGGGSAQSPPGSSIPIGISGGGYGLPGPHTLIAVASHSPNAAGTPVSGTSYGTAPSAGSALKLGSFQASRAAQMSSSIATARKKLGNDQLLDGYSTSMANGNGFASASSLGGGGGTPLSSSMHSHQQQPQQYDKANVKRERNRLAAERCRRKKLELIDSLQSENEQLKMELEHLKMELARYRGCSVVVE